MRRSLASRSPDQREKFLARLLIVAEGAEHGAGDRLGILLLDAAHHHAQCRASITTPTPSGLTQSWMACAIWLVSRS